MDTRLRLVPPAELVGEIESLLGGADVVVCPLGSDVRPTVAVAKIPEHFAGVIVATSGSTGDPKAVMLSRQALICAAELTHRRLGAPGTWVTALPVWYVAGLMTVVRAIVAGCDHLCVAPHMDRIPALSAAYLSMVPAQLHQALSDPVLLPALVGYRAVLVGGAGLDPTLHARADRAGVRIVTTYGMSETCGGVVYDGVPLDGVRIGFDDRDGAPPDRIVVTTPTVFSGYVGDPHGTAEVLNGQSFLTSDRGRVVDGRLLVDGRVDEIVQSGGVNVDLAHIQALLDEAFGSMTACFAVPDPVWGSTIGVASTGPDAGVIMERVGNHLSSAARPRIFLAVSELPRTSSGKIDRNGLVEYWRRHGERA